MLGAGIGGVVQSKTSHVPHHHHAHIHHLHSPMPSAAASIAAPPPPAQSLLKINTALLIDSSKVLASLATKPRNYLGSCVYLPSPTPKEGLSVTHPLLPRFEGRENSIFQVRIPKRFLGEPARRDVCRRRCVWGTDVYTDDSDVVAALVHTGHLPAWVPAEAAEAVRAAGARRTVVRGRVGAAPAPAPPAAPAMDLLVNLLILPPLERYAGCVRHALQSRGWRARHDGMSFAVWDTQWVAAGEAEARGGGGRKRRLAEREWVRRWGELPPGGARWGKGGWAGVEAAG